jgi:hypothetical protein
MAKTVNLRNGLPYTLKNGQTKICEIDQQRVVTVEIAGDPTEESARVMGPLYATAYAIRKAFKERDVVFAVEKLRARWPAANFGKPKSEWVGKYGLPVPEDLAELPELPPGKRAPGVDVRLERWDYGKVAVALHMGSYADEGPTIEGLMQYIKDQGCRIVPDSHEEIYLSDPNKTDEQKLKTLILYRLA